MKQRETAFKRLQGKILYRLSDINRHPARKLSEIKHSSLLYKRSFLAFWQSYEKAIIEQLETYSVSSCK